MKAKKPKPVENREVRKNRWGVNQTLLEINQEIEKIKNQNMKNAEKESKTEVIVDFDTMEYPEGSPFGKYTFAIPLMPDHLVKLKAKCSLNDIDVVEYLSNLIINDVEETFSMNPDEFNDAVYNSAEETLISILDEHIEPLIKSKSIDLPTFNSKTKIENLTINLNIGGESPKKDDSSGIESLLGIAGLAAMIFGSGKDKKKEVSKDEENSIKAEPSKQGVEEMNNDAKSVKTEGTLSNSFNRRNDGTPTASPMN